MTRFNLIMCAFYTFLCFIVDIYVCIHVLIISIKCKYFIVLCDTKLATYISISKILSQYQNIKDIANLISMLGARCYLVVKKLGSLYYVLVSTRWICWSKKQFDTFLVRWTVVLPICGVEVHTFWIYVVYCNNWVEFSGRYVRR